MRRLEIFGEDRERELAFITNDFKRSAQQIADLDKRRWQIGLFFKRIKQNLKIKRVLAKNPKAIALRIVTALIASVPLRKLRQANRITIPLKRIAAITTSYLFNQCEINQLIKQPGNQRRETRKISAP